VFLSFVGIDGRRLPNETRDGPPVVHRGRSAQRRERRTFAVHMLERLGGVDILIDSRQPVMCAEVQSSESHGFPLALWGYSLD
jgi:hypothetical protein